MQFNYELLETYKDHPCQYPPKNVNKYFTAENQIFCSLFFLISSDFSMLDYICHKFRLLTKPGWLLHQFTFWSPPIGTTSIGKRVQ